MEKTLITNARSSRAKFLGVYIKRLVSNTGAAYMMKGDRGNRRVPTGNLWMSAPVLEIVKRLEKNGFVKITGSR